MKYTISNPTTQKYVHHMKVSTVVLLGTAILYFIIAIVIFDISTEIYGFRNVIMQENAKKIMILSALIVTLSSVICITILCFGCSEKYYDLYSSDS